MSLLVHCFLSQENILYFPNKLLGVTYQHAIRGVGGGGSSSSNTPYYYQLFSFSNFSLASILDFMASYGCRYCQEARVAAIVKKHV